MSQDKPSDLYSSAIPFKRPGAATRRENAHPLAGHKFTVGQTLLFSPSIFEPATRKGSYCVVSLLPGEGGEHQYRVKCAADGHERVVREAQLAVE